MTSEFHRSEAHMSKDRKRPVRCGNEKEDTGSTSRDSQHYEIQKSEDNKCTICCTQDSKNVHMTHAPIHNSRTSGSMHMHDQNVDIIKRSLLTPWHICYSQESGSTHMLEEVLAVCTVMTSRHVCN